MARIRSLHPGQASDEDFVGLSMEARYFCLMLRCHADDYGVFEWKPKTLKMKIFPADNIDVVNLLDELQDANQVKQFTDDGKVYGAIRNFRKWQKPKTPSSLYPLPNELRNYVDPTRSISAKSGNDGEIDEQKGGDNKDEIRREEKANFVLPDSIPQEPWKAFEEMRQKIRKPMTDRAREMIVTKLGELKAQGYDPGAVLLQSVERCWQTVFPLKDKPEVPVSTEKIDPLRALRDKVDCWRKFHRPLASYDVKAALSAGLLTQDEATRA